MYRSRIPALLFFFVGLVSCSDRNEPTSPQPSVPEPVVLSVPADTNITAHSVLLSWTPSTAEDFSLYAVTMEDRDDSLLAAITDRNVVSYEVQSLDPETTYHFRVDVETTGDMIGRGNTVTVITGPEEPIFQPATTPDLLMENFKKAWEEQSIIEYEKLLATGFQFFFDPRDNLDGFVGGPSWDRSRELATATKMFSEQPGFDPIGQVAIPPIRGIEFTVFQKISDWGDPGADPLYTGTIRARYKISIIVSFLGVESSTRITGDGDFYVEPVEADGQLLWVIKVWEDQGLVFGARQEKIPPPMDAWSWGRWKAGY